MARKARKNRVKRGSADVRRKARPDPFQAQLAEAVQREQAGHAGEIQRACVQILAQQPDHVGANLQQAEQLQARGNHEAALVHWQHGLRREADNVSARFAYARCLVRAGRLQEAAAEFSQGLRTLQTKKLRVPPDALSGIYYELAEVYEGLRQDEDEEKALNRAIKLNPNNVQAHHMLGYVLDLRGASEPAQESYRRAITIAPTFAEAHRRLAFSKTHAAPDDEMRVMEELLAADGISPADASELAFGLGKAFEDIGQYSRAFEYWKKGNGLHRQLNSYDVARELVLGKVAMEVFTRDYIDAEAVAAPTSITPVFIVSMPRSGSSLVEQILASHSAIYAAGELTALRVICAAAVADFPHDLGRLKQADWQRLGQAYLQEVAGAVAREVFITDKFPSNYNMLAPIRLMFPTAKVIHCAREPMDIALSCYKNIFQPGALPYSYDLDDLGVVYDAYEKVMEHWRTLLPGWVYDLQYESLTAEPEPEVRRLLDFIGLPFEADCLSFYNNKRSTRTASAMQVRKPISSNSVRGWKNFARELQPFADARRQARRNSEG